MKKVLVFGMTDNPGGMESVIMNYYRHIDRSVLQFEFLCNTEKVAYEDEQMELLGYIQCDPQKNEECKKTNCYLNGGECRYTRKTEYGL